tara:strand:- start:329 stop:739 length:411 start_codon:yes stop_codon:yes gene_type:complete
MKESTMDIEQRLNQMERQIKRQRIGLFVLAAALCGVVSLAAKDLENGQFYWLTSRALMVYSESTHPRGGTPKVVVDAPIQDFSKSEGGGRIRLFNQDGTKVVEIGSNEDGNGFIFVGNEKGETVLAVGSTVEGNGY